MSNNSVDQHSKQEKLNATSGDSEISLPTKITKENYWLLHLIMSLLFVGIIIFLFSEVERSSKIFGGVLMVVGWVYFYWMFYTTLKKTELLLNNGKKTEGTITEVAKHSYSTGIKYKFSLPSGNYEGRIEVKSKARDWSVGNKVEVIFFPKKPEINSIL